MPSSSTWKFVEYQALASGEPSAFSMGPFGSKLTQRDYVTSGVPLTRGINLARGIFLDDEFVYISPEKADEVISANVRSGDLIFTHRGTIGQVSMIPRNPRFERYVVCSSQVKTRLDESTALPEFYYYWFRSPGGQQSILANTSTVGVPGISAPLSTIRQLKVPHPALSEQRAIATMLGALDDKITINERVIATVESIQAVHADTICKEATDLCRLSDIIDLKYGKALPASARTPGRIPVYGSNGISGSHDTALTCGPGIIIGRKGANAGSVSWSQQDFWAIDTAFYVQPNKSDIPFEFLYSLLRRVDFRGLVGDSAIPGLNREQALSISVQMPEREKIRKFAAYSVSVHSRPECNG